MQKGLLTLIIFCLCLSACVSENKETNIQKPIKKQTQELGFDFSKFPIKKEQLGNIKIGMTISEAEKQFSGLRKETSISTDFGYGGSSPAYLYYLKGNPVFALIPALGTDTLFAIVAADARLITTNGLHPGSSVQEIMNVYPKMMVSYVLMSGLEHFPDTANGWDFVFMTSPGKQVGEYTDINTSKPKITTIKTDWITIIRSNPD